MNIKCERKNKNRCNTFLYLFPATLLFFSSSFLKKIFIFFFLYLMISLVPPTCSLISAFKKLLYEPLTYPHYQSTISQPLIFSSVSDPSGFVQFYDKIFSLVQFEAKTKPNRPLPALQASFLSATPMSASVKKDISPTYSEARNLLQSSQKSPGLVYQSFRRKHLSFKPKNLVSTASLSQTVSKRLT